MDYKQTLMWQEINQIPSIFNRILSENSQTMQELCTAIKNGKATNFVAAARGSSDHALVYFKYLLEINSNYTVGLSAPSVVTIYKGKINYQNSIVIGCSESGMAEDVLEVIKKANEQGAITIGVTNDKQSPIAKESKYHLYCSAGKEEGVIATKTFVAQLYLLLWLALEISEKRAYLKTMRELPKGFEHLFTQIDELTTKYAEKFKDIKNGFILSRGLVYAVALQTELLLQETCYLQVKGSSGSDFYHGPMAMVGKDTPVIIYCARNEVDEELQSVLRADQVRLIERMLLRKAPVLLVTNDCVLSGKFSKCNDALINFSVPEEHSVLAFALFAQMFALKLSCLKGYNPDNPNGLEKTTITK